MALFSGSLYVFLRQQLYASLDEQLLEQAEHLLATVKVEDGRPVLEPTTANSDDGEYLLRLLDADS